MQCRLYHIELRNRKNLSFSTQHKIRDRSAARELLYFSLSKVYMSTYWYQLLLSCMEIRYTKLFEAAKAMFKS